MSRKRRQRNPDRSAANRPAATIEAPRGQRILALSVGIVLLALAAWSVWSLTSATRLCQQARLRLQSDPVAAERLAEQSANAAFGPYPAAFLVRSRALGALGKWAEATGSFSLIKDFKQCPQHDLIELGSAAATAQQWLLASLALEVARKQGNISPAMLKLTIQIEERRGNLHAVIASCESLAQGAPRDSYPWQVLARAHQQRGELTLSIQALREALARNPAEQDEPRLRTLLAEGLMNVGDLTGARTELDQLLKRDDLPDSVHLKNSFLLRMEGHPRDALAEAQRFLKTTPQSSQALLLSGMLQLDLGALDESVADLERALAIDPYNKEAHYKLADAYRRLERNREADEHLARCQELTKWRLEILDIQQRLAANSKNPELQRRLAKLYESVGEPETAVRLRQAIPVRQTIPAAVTEKP